MGKGNPISSGNLDTLVFLTEKPPPLSFSEGGGSMSPPHISGGYRAGINYDKVNDVVIQNLTLVLQRKDPVHIVDKKPGY